MVVGLLFRAGPGTLKVVVVAGELFRVGPEKLFFLLPDRSNPSFETRYDTWHDVFCLNGNILPFVKILKELPCAGK